MLKRILIVITVSLGVVFVPYFVGWIMGNTIFGKDFNTDNPNLIIWWVGFMGIIFVIGVVVIIIGTKWLLFELFHYIKNG